MRIDFHSHAFPAECFRLLQQYYPYSGTYWQVI